MSEKNKKADEVWNRRIEEEKEAKKMALEERTKSSIFNNKSMEHINHKLYDQNFYNSQIDDSLKSAKEYVRYLSDLFNFKSVIDFGCGRGTWLKGFEEVGVNKLVGLDGSWNNQENMLSQKIILIQQVLKIMPPHSLYAPAFIQLALFTQ